LSQNDSSEYASVQIQGQWGRLSRNGGKGEDLERRAKAKEKEKKGIGRM
jgi:hypothetical protein